MSQHLSFVAWDPRHAEVVARDDLAITRRADGIEIVSSHHHLRSGLPTHQVRYRCDADWTPRSIVVAADGAWCYQVRFRAHESVTVARVTDRCERTIVERHHVARDRAAFLLNVGLYFPLCLVARYRHDEGGVQRFELIPEGFCLVELRPGTAGVLRVHIAIELPQVSDELTGTATPGGDLIEYRTSGAGLVVRRTEENQLC